MVSPIGDIHRYVDIFLIVQVLKDSIHLIPAMVMMPSGTMEQKQKNYGATFSTGFCTA
jgi:hypothetical protein